MSEGDSDGKVYLRSVPVRLRDCDHEPEADWILIGDYSEVTFVQNFDGSQIHQYISRLSEGLLERAAFTQQIDIDPAEIAKWSRIPQWWVTGRENTRFRRMLRAKRRRMHEKRKAAKA